jgi:periplasmic divalent cation tolerance protein
MMTATASKMRIAFVMAADEEEAARIGQALVAENLAACVNIAGPVRSIYRWRGAIEDAREFMLIIKTQARLFDRLARRVKELHSYEVPEIIALPLAAGWKPYLEWIIQSTETRGAPADAAPGQS